MARRSMAVVHIKEILVHWDAGEGVSSIARSLGYSRPMVQKYLWAAASPASGTTPGSIRARACAPSSAQ